MREILFRGKRVQGNEWVEGYFFKSDMLKRKRESLKATLIFTPDLDTFIYLPKQKNSVIVIPETVGQYTNLNDKNGKMLFEGDIIDKGNSVVKFGEYKDSPEAWVCVYEYGFYFANGKDKDDAVEWGTAIIDDAFEDFEIIGNIYDNPELLEDKIK